MKLLRELNRTRSYLWQFRFFINYDKFNKLNPEGEYWKVEKIDEYGLVCIRIVNLSLDQIFKAVSEMLKIKKDEENETKMARCFDEGVFSKCLLKNPKAKQVI